LRQDLTNAEIIECECGCGMLKAEQFKDDGYTILSYYIHAFGVHQETVWDKFKRRMQMVWDILRGKEYRLYEIVISSNEDLNRFKFFVNQMVEIKKDGIF
jgi:hypothetical protein